MKSIPLLRTGAAFISVSMAAFDGVTMPNWKFLVDTGASGTTVPKNFLINMLGYTEEYIQDNKLVLPDDKKPLMANGKRIDLYKVKAPRINISGHEIQPDYILTSDSVKTLNYLLGLDILQYFKFTYDFDAIGDDAPHGQMFFEFRESRILPFTKLGDTFSYKLSD